MNAVRELTAYLVENIGCRFTATKMLKPLGVASASTITQWCDWIEKAYLFFFVPIFSDSGKSRLLNPKAVRQAFGEASRMLRVRDKQHTTAPPYTTRTRAAAELPQPP